MISGPEALARCREALRRLVDDGYGWHQAKQEISLMMAAQPDENYSTGALNILGDDVFAFRPKTQRGQMLLANILTEIDRRMRSLRLEHA